MSKTSRTVSVRLRGLDDRVQHIENQVLDDLNAIRDVGNVAYKVLEPDEVLDVDIENEILDVDDEVLEVGTSF